MEKKDKASSGAASMCHAKHGTRSARTQSGEHSSLGITGSKSSTLEGKLIVVGITGSIAAVRSFGLVRELMRRGAAVQVVMSRAACGILHPDAMHYASGREVITEITGEVQHVNLMGESGCADLLLIAPCTANTIGKIAHGIDDTPVTTFATTALGSGRPIIVVPAMHKSMYKNLAVAENLRKLREIGVSVVAPREDEQKAKIATNDEVVLEAERALCGNELAGKHIVVSAGATEVDIDPVRIMTNRASGRTGLEVAREAYRHGAEVSLIHNIKYIAEIERSLNAQKVRTPKEMQEALMRELKDADVFISTAAVNDFSVDASADKIGSGREVSLALRQAPKLVKEVQGKFPGLFVVGFKAETNKSDAELARITRGKMETEDWGLAVGNDVAKGGMGSEGNRVVIIGKKTERWVEGSKREIARHLLNVLCGALSGTSG